VSRRRESWNGWGCGKKKPEYFERRKRGEETTREEEEGKRFLSCVATRYKEGGNRREVLEKMGESDQLPFC